MRTSHLLLLQSKSITQLLLDFTARVSNAERFLLESLFKTLLICSIHQRFNRLWFFLDLFFWFLPCLIPFSAPNQISGRRKLFESMVISRIGLFPSLFGWILDETFFLGFFLIYFDRLWLHLIEIIHHYTSIWIPTVYRFTFSSS